MWVRSPGGPVTLGDSWVYRELTLGQHFTVTGQGKCHPAAKNMPVFGGFFCGWPQHNYCFNYGMKPGALYQESVFIFSSMVKPYDIMKAFTQSEESWLREVCVTKVSDRDILYIYIFLLNETSCQSSNDDCILVVLQRCCILTQIIKKKLLNGFPSHPRWNQEGFLRGFKLAGNWNPETDLLLHPFSDMAAGLSGAQTAGWVGFDLSDT